MTPWTPLNSHQVLCPRKFSRRERWSGLPFPSPGVFPTQELNPQHLLPPLYWQADSVPLCYLGSNHPQSKTIKFTQGFQLTLKSWFEQGSPGASSQKLVVGVCNVYCHVTYAGCPGPHKPSSLAGTCSQQCGGQGVLYPRRKWGTTLHRPPPPVSRLYPPWRKVVWLI